MVRVPDVDLSENAKVAVRRFYVILAWLLKGVNYILAWFRSLLPDLHLEKPLAYLTSIVRYIYSWNTFLPISDCVVPIIGVGLVVMLFFVIYRVVMFVINLIRGSGIK
jgi:hypothetical protein